MKKPNIRWEDLVNRITEKYAGAIDFLNIPWIVAFSARDLDKHRKELKRRANIALKMLEEMLTKFQYNKLKQQLIDFSINCARTEIIIVSIKRSFYGKLIQILNRKFKNQLANGYVFLCYC